MNSLAACKRTKPLPPEPPLCHDLPAFAYNKPNGNTLLRHTDACFSTLNFFFIVLTTQTFSCVALHVRLLIRFLFVFSCVFDFPPLLWDFYCSSGIGRCKGLHFRPYIFKFLSGICIYDYDTVYLSRIFSFPQDLFALFLEQ